MSKKTLLLNSTYEVLHFISDRKALKLLVKDKVEIISSWPDQKIRMSKIEIDFPATLRLKYYVRKNYKELAFSRKAVFKRDKFCCQYCGDQLKSGHLTIDHILPRCLGGDSSFINCVTSCYDCNNRKGNKTLDQSNMKLINKPVAPAGYVHFISDSDKWHAEWDDYLANNKIF